MSDSDKQLTHCVFFTLKDNSAQNCQALIDDCHTYLTQPDGVVSLHAGARDEGLDRDVNDTGFDVSLIVVFENRQAHDVYQDHDQHVVFVDRNKDSWKSVRVFDAIV